MLVVATPEENGPWLFPEKGPAPFPLLITESGPCPLPLTVKGPAPLPLPPVLAPLENGPFPLLFTAKGPTMFPPCPFPFTADCELPLPVVSGLPFPVVCELHPSVHAAYYYKIIVNLSKIDCNFKVRKQFIFIMIIYSCNQKFLLFFKQK